MTQLQRYFCWGQRDALVTLLLQGAPKGVMIIGGIDGMMPSFGVAVRAGAMYDRRHFGL